MLTITRVGAASEAGANISARCVAGKIQLRHPFSLSARTVIQRAPAAATMRNIWSPLAASRVNTARGMRGTRWESHGEAGTNAGAL